MPSRILREGILTSRRVNRLTPPAELFYRRLMSVVDDFGRYFSDLTLLLAACYPLQIKVMDEVQIEGHLAECVKADLVVTYTVDDTGYLQMLDTRQQLRAKNSKFPAPDLQLINKRLSDGKPDDAQSLGNRLHLDGGGDECGDGVEYGGGEERTAKPRALPSARKKSDGFSEFWAKYPRKQKRQAAEKAWQKITHDPTLDALIIEALEAQKQSRQWAEIRFVPHASTWLNGKRWEDEVPRETAPQQQAVDKWLERTGVADEAGGQPPAVEGPDVDLAEFLGKNGISIGADDPLIRGWISKGITIAIAEEACDRARDMQGNVADGSGIPKSLIAELIDKLLARDGVPA